MNSLNEDILLVGNDVKKLAYCGFSLKILIIEILENLPRHLCSNISLLGYKAILYVVVRKRLNTRQHGELFLKNYESFQLWVFEGISVICAKPQFQNLNLM